MEKVKTIHQMQQMQVELLSIEKGITPIYGTPLGATTFVCTHSPRAVTGYSLFMTFNCACTRMTLMNFELMWLVLSNIFFWTQNSAQYLLQRDLGTNVLYNGQCRAWWSLFFLIMPNDTCKKNVHSNTLKLSIWSMVRCSWLLGCSCMVRKFTKVDRVCKTARKR